MTLRQLATLLELARSGSAKVAADRLFVTQPAVSGVLASLQRELGVELVAREGRGLRLTASGLVLAGYARRILGLLDEAAAATAGAANPQRGRVRLAAVTTVGEHLLPVAIAGFRARHPGAELSLDVANRRHVWDRLEAHEVDLVIAGRPPAHRALRTRAVRPYELVLVGAPRLVAGRLRPPALGAQTWLLREPGSGTRATVEEYLATHGLSPRTLTLGSNGAVREAAAVGLGITLIAREAVGTELANGRLGLLSALGVPLQREWHAVTRNEEALPATVALFLDHLVAECGLVRVAGRQPATARIGSGQRR